MSSAAPPMPNVVSQSVHAEQPGNQMPFYSPNRQRHVKGMAISQITMGGLLVIFGIATTAINSNFSNITIGNISVNGVLGTGIWTGILFILTGSLGAVSSHKNTYGWVVYGSGLLNIICSANSMALLGLSSLSVDLNELRPTCPSFFSGYGYFSRTPCPNYTESKILYGLDIFSLIVSLAQLAIAIAITVLSCSATCCLRRLTQNAQQQQLQHQPQQLLQQQPQQQPQQLQQQLTQQQQFQLYQQQLQLQQQQRFQSSQNLPQSNDLQQVDGYHYNGPTPTSSLATDTNQVFQPMPPVPQQSYGINPQMVNPSYLTMGNPGYLYTANPSYPPMGNPGYPPMENPSYPPMGNSSYHPSPSAPLYSSVGMPPPKGQYYQPASETYYVQPPPYKNKDAKHY